MPRKKMTDYQKKQKKLQAYHNDLVERSIKVLRTTIDRINDALSNNVKVDVSFDPVATMAKLQEYQQGKKINKSTEAYLKEAARSTYYDRLVHYNLDYQSHEGTFTVNKTAKVSQYDINKIRNKEASNKLTTVKETSLLKAWSEATMVANNYNAPILQTPEDVQNFLKQSRRKKLDLSFGGMSSLINDLSYSQDIDISKDFITWIRDLMQANKQMFAEIEKWYNETDEGRKARYLLNTAKGRNWYKNYKRFAEAITEFIDTIENRYQVKAPDALKYKAEAVASEYTEMD